MLWHKMLWHKMVWHKMIMPVIAFGNRQATAISIIQH